MKKPLEKIRLAGIQMRTNNFKGSAKKDIGGLWQRFFAEGFASKIEHKINEDMYCVYTEYESDYRGDYTCFLGYAVSDYINHPELASLEIEVDSYQTFDASGKLPDSVLNKWEEIWADTNLKRAYHADFDLYKFSKSKEGEDPEVEIYLSISE